MALVISTTTQNISTLDINVRHGDRESTKGWNDEYPFASIVRATAPTKLSRAHFHLDSDLYNSRFLSKTSVSNGEVVAGLVPECILAIEFSNFCILWLPRFTNLR